MAKRAFHLLEFPLPSLLFLFSLPLILALPFLSHSEPLPPGSAIFGFQYRLFEVNPQAGPTESLSASNYFLALAQESGNWGNFSGFINWADEADYHRLGSWLLEFKDFYFNGAKLDSAFGDNFIRYSLIADSPFRFSNLPIPDISLEGARVRLSWDRGDVDLFGGNLIALRGAFATEVNYLDETLVGVRSRYALLPGLRLGCQILRTGRTEDEDDPVIFRRNDIFSFSAEVEPWPGYELLQGELSLSHFQKREEDGERDKGWDYSLILGPSIRRPQLTLDANFRHIGPNYQPFSQFFWNSQEGLFFSGEYRPWGFLSLFASADRFCSHLEEENDPVSVNTFSSTSTSSPRLPPKPLRKAKAEDRLGTLEDFFSDLAADPDSNDDHAQVDSILTKTGLLGFRLGAPPFPLLSARYMVTENNSCHDEPSGTNNRLDNYTAEITYSYLNWFPIFRYQRFDYEDRTSGGSDYSSDDYFLELRKTMRDGSYSWISGEWNQLRKELPSSVTQTYAIRLGTDYLPFHALEVRGEVLFSRSRDNLHLQDTERKGVLLALNTYLPWNFNLYLEYAFAKIDEKISAADRGEHRLYIRASQRLNWGKPLPAKGGIAPDMSPPGYGTILGYAFDDRNGNGVRDVGEPPVPGIRLQLEDGSIATSDGQGKFSFINVLAGDHTLTLDIKRVPIQFDFSGEAKRKLEVKRRGTVQVDFAFLLLGKMAGRVIEDANGNGKADKGEKGLANALILASGQGKEFSTYTDEEGNYSLENLRGGAHRLILDPSSLPEGAEITSEQSLSASLVPGSELTGLNFLVQIKPRPMIKKIFGEPEGETQPLQTEGDKNQPNLPTEK